MAMANLNIIKQGASVFGMLVLAAATCAGATNAPAVVPEQPLLLAEVQHTVQTSLYRLDRDLKIVATAMSQLDFDAPEARVFLRRMCALNKGIVDCVILDATGRIVAAEPAAYKKAEGVNVSDQAHVRRLQTTRAPVCSEWFRSVEGLDAIDLEWPIMGTHGLKGAVSILIQPDIWLAALLEPLLKSAPAHVWVLQRDGLVLHNTERDAAGKNLMTDEAYAALPGLRKAVRTMAHLDSGCAGYEIPANGADTARSMEVRWLTVALHDVEWRVAMIQPQPIRYADVPQALRSLSGSSVVDVLKVLTESRVVQEALLADRKADVMTCFQGFVQTYPSIYAVQWIDVQGVSRFGYPPEHSLSNVNCIALGAKGKKIVAALKDQKLTQFDDALMEGGVGTFTLVPVFKDQQYLGMLYTIHFQF